ncbi:beta-galactosidase [Streptomyces sp. CA-210063]|uniref:beta-galactosidase n=1 Tax=Streptomyces sp. CA-210063 TaxID=2801029 RepID=UPI003FA7A909
MPGLHDTTRGRLLLGGDYNNGIGVVLATPISSPPPWTGRLHPDTLPVTEDGRTEWWGGRPVLGGLPERVEAVRRGEALFVLHHGREPVTVEVPGTHHDLRTGTAVTDRVTPGRYGVAVPRP